MVTILNEPDAIVRTLNEAEYTLQTDNFITTAGVTYKQNFYNNSNPTDGLTLIVAFGAYNQTFTFKTTPVTDFDIQIPPSPTGFDTALRANMIAAFGKHYTIVANYHIGTIAGGVFSIVAREAKTSTWDITFSGTAISGGNLQPVVGYPVAGVTEVRRDGFAIHTQLLKESGNGSGVYTVVLEERNPPDADSVLVYDPAEVLTSLCDYILPSYNQAAPSIAPLLVRFKIGYGEYYTDAVQWYRQTGTKRALLAGLPEAQIPANTFYTDYFNTAIGQKFLTTCPRGQLATNKAAHHYLYYYQRPAYPTAYYTVYIEHTDGTLVVVDQLFIISQPDDILILPTGYTQLAIDAKKSVGKTVRRWGIEIGANGLDYQDYTDRTEIFWYTLDDKPYQNNRYFLLANPCGGVDTLWCSGAVAYSVQNDSEAYNVYKPTDTATVVGATQKNTFGQRQQIHKINTGFISRVYLEYVVQLLLFSTACYEVVNNQYRAVIIERDSIKDTHTDADGKFEATFTYKYAQEDKA